MEERGLADKKWFDEKNKQSMTGTFNRMPVAFCTLLLPCALAMMCWAGHAQCTCMDN